jgi:tetratricopeptide (TPR) repeat protein
MQIAESVSHATCALLLLRFCRPGRSCRRAGALAERASTRVAGGKSLAQAYVDRGLTLHGEGHYDLAIADFSEALRLQPRDTFALKSRGNSWVQKNEPARALGDYEAAIRIEPDFADAIHNRGTLARDRGDYAAAMKDFNRAIAIQPGKACPSCADMRCFRTTATAPLADFDLAIVDPPAPRTTASGRIADGRKDRARASRFR